MLVYTGLRVGLFLACWLTLELLTPIYGVWALVLAILGSGAIAIVVLDRPRNRVGLAAAGFFGRINERIEASARAEDDDDATAVDAPLPAATSGDGEDAAQQESVDKQ